MIASLLLAVAAAGASAPQDSAPVRTPLVQATATVRIVQGERVTADNLPKTATVSETEVRDADGIEHKARLVEFP